MNYVKVLISVLLLSVQFACCEVEAQTASNFTLSSSEPDSKRWYVPQTSRPIGATTQWMSFWFYSTNFFKNASRAHFAVGVRGALSGSNVSGRGITIGHTEEALNGCNDYVSLPEGMRPGMSQIENWFPGGNRLFRESCRPFAGYKDSTWYRVTIHANDTNWVAFWVDDANGNRIDAGYEPAVLDLTSPFNSTLTGLFIGYSGAGGAAYFGSWSMRFAGIQYGWF